MPINALKVGRAGKRPASGEDLGHIQRATNFYSQQTWALKGVFQIHDDDMKRTGGIFVYKFEVAG